VLEVITGGHTDREANSLAVSRLQDVHRL